MSPRTAANIRLDNDLIEGMREIYEKEGILQSEQVRRAVRAWLTERGVIAPRTATKTARKRAATRKRA